MRLFLGAAPTPEILSELVSYQSLLKSGPLGNLYSWRWTKPENIHLTFHFVGEVEETTYRLLLERLEGIREKESTVERLEEAIAFPDIKNATVVGVGTPPGKKPSSLDIQIALGFILQGMGIQIEKRAYRPHVSLGRLGTAKNLEGKLPPPPVISYPVVGVNLYESFLEKSGSRYQVIHSVPLR